MATTTMYRNANGSQPSMKAPTLPPYTEYPDDIDQRDIELVKLSRTSSSDSLSGDAAATARDPLPAGISQAAAAATNADFRPTRQLQVQTSGKQWLSLPTAPRPDPIPIFSLAPAADSADGYRIDRPVYLSLRPQRRSGSSVLVHGDDPAETPLTSTTYRFGPGRAPRVCLADPNAPPPAAADGDEQQQQQITGDDFEIEGVKAFSRAVCFRSARLGTFQWRYADRKERAPWNASSLLVLERVPDSAGASASVSSTEKPVRVAQLLRNEQYRSPGSRASTAGNGGRLMLDLTVVDEKQRDLLERLVVTTILVMLKKEVDRRRMHQIMIMGAAASGGP